jgi:hypothetical protein
MLTYLFISVTLFGIFNLVPLSSLALMCSADSNIECLVTKGYHGCKCRGPFIKARQFDDL